MNRLNKWFWHWLFRGTNGNAGYHHLVKWPWTTLDIFFGAAMTYLVPMELQEAAKVFLLPLAGIFIGISVGWTGNAHTVLQTPELEEIADYVDGGMEGMAWEFQLAVLVLLVMIVLWGLVALGVLDAIELTRDGLVRHGAGLLLYAGSSLSLRVCWNVVDNAQRLLVTRTRMRQELQDRGKLPLKPASGSEPRKKDSINAASTDSC